MRSNKLIVDHNTKVRAMRYFGLCAKESALIMDRLLDIQEYKEKFGSSYDRATTWYSLLTKKPIKKFNWEDLRTCYYYWNLLVSLGQMMGETELVDGSKVDKLSLESKYIDKTFNVMKKIFNIDSNALSDDDKIDFIQTCLHKFDRETKTETIHKASIKVIKMSYSDIDNFGKGFVFDSRKVGDRNTSMRYILTSEDGISRLLSELGKEQVIINLNTTDVEEDSEKDKEKYRKTKEELFLNGITDIATGKHYLCSAPSASSTRHVDFPFVKADSPEEIYDIWCNITGFSNLDELVSNIGKQKEDGIYTVFAKLKARVAQNGANSLCTGKTASDRIRDRLRNANVVFVPDCSGTVNTPYKKITSRGVLTMKLPDGTVVDERVE